jgi:hypothetical protein
MYNGVDKGTPTNTSSTSKMTPALLSSFENIVVPKVLFITSLADLSITKSYISEKRTSRQVESVEVGEGGFTNFHVAQQYS